MITPTIATVRPTSCARIVCCAPPSPHMHPRRSAGSVQVRIYPPLPPWGRHTHGPPPETRNLQPPRAGSDEHAASSNEHAPLLGRTLECLRTRRG
ncbi:hypothetical protein C8Q80DRAFT_521632 [Daedaleopsis nitida]|nr:hypothetical protein C8Q80DRAFT_521632 [Daedaleopsis nitida]